MGVVLAVGVSRILTVSVYDSIIQTNENLPYLPDLVTRYGAEFTATLFYYYNCCFLFHCLNFHFRGHVFIMLTGVCNPFLSFAAS